jgi:hypothetical protein
VEAADTAAGIRDERLVQQLLHRVALARRNALGGGPEPDFDALIELITTTIEPDSWEDVGGPGSIAGFEGGVRVDASGVMRRVHVGTPTKSVEPWVAATGNRDSRRPAVLRKISLTRLERHLMARRALGQPVNPEAGFLAGLYRIDYVVVYPALGEIVLAGPAGAWSRGAEGRMVEEDSGRPVLHLDDLVTVLRCAHTHNGLFGCAITPLEANLKRTQSFVNASAAKRLAPGAAARTQWVATLRDHVGRQRVDVHGIDARTRTARVLIEADYRMKLIGLGLEESVPGVPSYLELVKPDASGQLPPLDVLRWWFTLGDIAVRTDPTRTVFQLEGPAVKLLSENELLTHQGRRIATGAADEWNREFAASFTRHLEELSVKHPVFAELRNILELAVVAAIVSEEDLPARVGWSRTYFGDATAGGLLKYAVAGVRAPQAVESVVNCRVIDGRRFIAGVSGGVRVDARALVRDNIGETEDSRWASIRDASAPPREDELRWWWD